MTTITHRTPQFDPICIFCGLRHFAGYRCLSRRRIEAARGQSGVTAADVKRSLAQSAPHHLNPR